MSKNRLFIVLFTVNSYYLVYNKLSAEYFTIGLYVATLIENKGKTCMLLLKVLYRNLAFEMCSFNETSVGSARINCIWFLLFVCFRFFPIGLDVARIPQQNLVIGDYQIPAGVNCFCLAHFSSGWAFRIGRCLFCMVNNLL